MNNVYCVTIDTLDVSDMFSVFSGKTKIPTLWNAIALILTAKPRMGRIKLAAVL